MQTDVPPHSAEIGTCTPEQASTQDWKSRFPKVPGMPGEQQNSASLPGHMPKVCTPMESARRKPAAARSIRTLLTNLRAFMHLFKYIRNTWWFHKMIGDP